jgi:hypothetical protein
MKPLPSAKPTPPSPHQSSTTGNTLSGMQRNTWRKREFRSDYSRHYKPIYPLSTHSRLFPQKMNMPYDLTGLRHSPTNRCFSDTKFLRNIKRNVEHAGKPLPVLTCWLGRSALHSDNQRPRNAFRTTTQAGGCSRNPP